ncbi:hypothetical protein D3C81_1397250 [compost metagenome]
MCFFVNIKVMFICWANKKNITAFIIQFKFIDDMFPLSAAYINKFIIILLMHRQVESFFHKLTDQ